MMTQTRRTNLAWTVALGLACFVHSAPAQVRKLHTRDMTRLSQVQVADYLKRSDIVTNINWFMYVPVKDDGVMAIVDGISKAGDYVDLVAERDVICVASNCAQIYNPCNGFDPTPVRFITYQPE